MILLRRNQVDEYQAHFPPLAAGTEYVLLRYMSKRYTFPKRIVYSINSHVHQTYGITLPTGVVYT